MTTTDTDKNRPPADERAVNDRTAPIRVTARTRFLYSESTDCLCCPGRHIFCQAADVTGSEVPSAYTTRQGLQDHVHRAIAAFGDDADLVIEVRRATPEDLAP